MVRKSVPEKLWFYGYRWVNGFISPIFISEDYLDDYPSVPSDRVHTIHIGIPYFGFKYRVWHHPNAGLGPIYTGSCISIYHRIVRLLCCHFLTPICILTSVSLVQRSQIYKFKQMRSSLFLQL